MVAICAGEVVLGGRGGVRQGDGQGEGEGDRGELVKDDAQ